MGRLGIWASPSPGTAAPLPPAQAGLPGSLARCQVRRPCGQQGGASGGSAEDVAGRPGLKQHPSLEARGQKVRAPQWVRGGCRAGGRQAAGPAGQACRGRAAGRIGHKAGQCQAWLLPPRRPPSRPPPGPPSSEGRPAGVHGARQEPRHRAVAVAAGGRAEEGPARRGPGLSRRKTSQGLQIAALSFFF